VTDIGGNQAVVSGDNLQGNSEIPQLADGFYNFALGKII
jgi:hypothetical protein